MTTENRDASCAERLPAHLESRLAVFRALDTLAQISGVDDLGQRTRRAAERVEIEHPDNIAEATERDADDLREAASERVYEYPLGVSTFRVWRIDLSTGGPGELVRGDDGRRRRRAVDPLPLPRLVRSRGAASRR